jgi:N-acetylmuramoyl-L-alanine amidase
LLTTRRQATVRALARPLAGVALLVLAVLPASAGSADRQQQQPARDFEQPLPAVERLPVAERAASAHADEGPVTHRSPVIEAPASFDAAGIARELRPVELRAREAGGDWSNWIEIANGDPAWFGGADEVQVRTRGYRPDGKLHYVSVPTVPATATRARGDSTKPAIVSRREWGAERRRGGCERRRRPGYGKVKAAAVHHTVGTNNYSRAEAPGVVLAICRYHRNTLRWDDIGYQALVDRFGNIYEGRDGGLGRPVIGAQAQGVNTQTTGVAVMGTHTNKGISAGSMRGLTRWLAWKLDHHDLTAQGKTRLKSAGGETSRYSRGEKFRVKHIFGHRKANLTACPGDALYRELPQLRRRVEARMKKLGGKDPKDPDGGGIGG